MNFKTYRGVKIGYKPTIWFYAVGSLGLLGVASVCMYLVAESLPTTAIFVPVVGWGMMLAAYYSFPVVRYLWDSPFLGDLSYDNKPCTLMNPGTEIFLHTTSLPCQVCNLPYTIPNNTKATYIGHHNLDDLQVDALHLHEPIFCPHCGEEVDSLAIPCGAPGYSWQVPQSKRE